VSLWCVSNLYGVFVSLKCVSPSVCVICESVSMLWSTSVYVVVF